MEKGKTEKEEAQAERIQALQLLLRSAAHDFNNLLMPIIGTLPLLSLENEKEASRIDRLRTAAEKLRELNQEILAFVTREQADYGTVNEMLQKYSHVWRVMLPRRIKFELLPAAALPPAHMDAGPFLEAVLNLAAAIAFFAGSRESRFQLKTGIRTLNSDELKEFAGGLAPGRFVSCTGAFSAQEPLPAEAPALAAVWHLVSAARGGACLRKKEHELEFVMIFRAVT